MTKFDYIIVGAGSAGSVLARRLSQDPSSRVLVLEYGGKDDSIFVQMPTALAIPMHMKRFDWGFYTDPEPGLAGRSIHQARGKVIGGSSSINGMVFVRGNRGDFDDWERDGATNWGYRHVLPYFRRSEDCAYGGDEYRSTGGEQHVSNGNNMRNPLYRAFIEAGHQAGYPLTEDYNGFQQEGFGRMDMSVKNGVRWSTANGYLKPSLSRPNLRLEMHALTTRILFEDKRAVGVQYQNKAGRTVEARAEREVILASGPVNSPKLLMLSGIGPEVQLRDHGIDVIHHLPGVGENLHDHLELWMQHECTQRVSLNGMLNPLGKAWIGAYWLLFKKGLGASNHFEANGYIRSRPGIPYPDIQYHFLAGAIAYDGSSAAKGHGFQAHLGPNKPKSRGRLTLRSANPKEAPRLFFNYLDHEDDRRVFRDGMRLTREIFAQPALAPYRGRELMPGDDVQTDEEMDSYVALHAETAYHPCGTCKMGSDSMAVVDPETRVHGVRNLRVIDSSIMPTITNGNLNAPTIMIGEKGADHVLGGDMLPASNADAYRTADWESSQRPGEPHIQID